MRVTRLHVWLPRKPVIEWASAAVPHMVWAGRKCWPVDQRFRPTRTRHDDLLVRSPQAYLSSSEFELANAAASSYAPWTGCYLDWSDKWCFVYIDDIIIYCRNAAEHIYHLGLVTKKLSEGGIKIKPDDGKQKSMTYLLEFEDSEHSSWQMKWNESGFFSKSIKCVSVGHCYWEWIERLNEWDFRPPLCTYRLNWAKRTSWGWWDEWDDTVLQTQDSKLVPWRSEAEHATSRSRRLPTILSFTRGWGRNIFVSFKPPRPGTEPRTLAWKAAVLATTLGPPPSSWQEV